MGCSRPGRDRNNNTLEKRVSAAGWLSDLSSYRAKVFSALRLLPEDVYERGLRRMEAALSKGPIQHVGRYLLLWARR
jgi:hypothetical protein